MSVPVLPESAPFTPEQRAWLNGYFAGLLNLDPGNTAQAGAIAVAEPTTPADDFDRDDPPWHDDSLSLDERLALAEERPHDDKLMAAMAQLDCGSCGYICRSYADAIASGDETDLTLCVPGAKDTSKALKKLVKLNVSAGVENNMPANAPPEPSSGYDRNNPYPATLIDVKRLNKEGSAKDVRFVALDLDGSGLTYEVGDALGVQPCNCGELVDAIIGAGGWSGDEPVPTPRKGDVPLREALTEHYTITAADEELALCLADAATDTGEAEQLRVLAESDELDTLDLLDLLTGYPSARPEPSVLVENLGPLNARLYSISSSLAAHPGEVHLTVGMVRYETGGRERKGVASTYLGERAGIGDKVGVYVQKAHGFALPTDGATPIIMVGPGTGVAPFRAFIEQRFADNATGKSWLLFGDQRRATDFLYEAELTRYVEQGALTRLETAFSRDQSEKVYVQHRMLEHGEEMWRWLQEGAHFYVCGDAKRMANDVNAALVEIAREHGGMTEADAKVYVKELSKSGRYQRDVY